jgi:transcriptional regulator of acetoin/glycerol metabolism
LDILSDLESTLISAGVPVATAVKIAGELRRNWGGDTVYIRHGRSENIALAREVLSRGGSVAAAAKAAGVSRRTVYRRLREWVL